MNELLQQHGCANVFTVPEGLKELMSDISREVLREQPKNINKFISNYLSVLLITREHGLMAVKILDDLCDCRPSVSEHLMQLGMQSGMAQLLSEMIKEEIEGFEPEGEKEVIKESQIIKKILGKVPLDEETSARVCQIIRNAYRDYWYRKKTMEKSFKMKPEEPWKIAARRTLELYKRTKPSLSEINRATEKIQAAYKGYYVRRNLLRHLKPKTKKRGPKVDLPGPPLDIAASREIDLGPLLSINVPEDDIHKLFEEHTTETLGLPYDPMKTITHVPDEDENLEYQDLEENLEYPKSKSRMTKISTSSQMQSQSERKSRISGIVSQEESGIEPKSSRIPSVVPSQVSEGRRSRLPSQIESRKSKINGADVQKISFSEGAEVIPDDEPIVEDIKEVLAPEAFDIGEVEETEDVPEDIIDEQTEYEDSIPASIPSAPGTASTTDVEDEAEYLGISTEEEAD